MRRNGTTRASNFELVLIEQLERKHRKMSEQINKPEQPFAHLVRALQEGEAQRLSQCIEQIDNRLVNCRKSLEEYRRLRVALRVINSQLSRLGAEPLSLSDDMVSHDFIEMIRSRIDHFKSSGKL
jgi:hypothetical protein